MLRLLLTLAVLLAPASLSAQDAVDTDTLMQDLRILSADDMAGRAVGTSGGERAQAYIARRFTELGLEVHRQPFRIPLSRGRIGRGTNLMAVIPGSEQPGKTIVVSAHYDHVGVQRGRIHNGADDNASGVSSLFAVAAALQRTPPKHNVLLVAFEAEEAGLYGARIFTAHPPVPLDTMILNVNLDMIARGDRGILWAVGPRHFPAIRPAIEAAGANSPIPLQFGLDALPGRGRQSEDSLILRSDQGAFGLAGIPFVLFHTGEHDDYHEPGDDAERIDPRRYAGVVAVVLDALRRLDGDAAALNTAREQARRVKIR